MTTKTKWIIGGALTLIALLLIVIFSKNVWNWFENMLVDLLIYLIVFGAGWLLGRFGGRPKRDAK
ncbi:hypothetical protein [uncultured Alistipes sp.]|uniref:hypothetical protein n=1 Tax=uncultured Alistipes sp. TaxID=538949 RepID=UPI002601053C|nr:hypothetical protein [uncultured Alistipes sp.]